MSLFALTVGAFIGTYINNPKFRVSVDKGINELIGKGVDALNKGGAVPVETNNEQPQQYPTMD